MKTLVTYFSRSGYTESLAKDIAQRINGDLDKIKDDKSWKGALGFVKGGYYALKKKKTQIIYTKKPEEYDMVIIISPVWAGKVPPAINSYCIKLKDKFKNLALVLDCESSDLKKSFDYVESISPKLNAKLGIAKKKMSDDDIKKSIEMFVEEIKEIS